MHGIKPVATFCLTVAVAVAPAGARTVEEVIARHVEARGGGSWKNVTSMKLEGSFKAFSEQKSFTMLRKQGNKYHLEMGFLDSEMLVGYDGETAWSDSGDGAKKVDGLERSILIREADFVTPLFDYEEMGYEVELLGDVEFEGMPAIGIKLKRDDDLEETWYLDPKTYLEMGRISPGSDWLGEVERTNYYDDFREVSGVMVPFYTESQWYTRNRVFEVKNIETNVEVDDSMFGIPRPPGMGPISAMVGNWDVALHTRQQPGEEWQDAERSSKIEALLGGGLLQEQYQTSQGIDVVRTISYDRFHEMYRVTHIDGTRAQLNVQEGKFGDNGRLVVSNVDTGTSWSGYGMTFHGRLSVFDITEDGFAAEYETSIDGGESWFLNQKATYTRSAE